MYKPAQNNREILCQLLMIFANFNSRIHFDFLADKKKFCTFLSLSVNIDLFGMGNKKKLLQLREIITIENTQLKRRRLSCDCGCTDIKKILCKNIVNQCTLLLLFWHRDWFSFAINLYCPSSIKMHERLHMQSPTRMNVTLEKCCTTRRDVTKKIEKIEKIRFIYRVVKLSSPFHSSLFTRWLCIKIPAW